MARVLISMSDEFLETIDKVATNEQRSRSELIRQALRTYMNKIKIRNSALAATNATILETLLTIDK